MITPYEYQQADIDRYVAEPTYAGLNASVVGTGKTLVAVESARLLGSRKILIVAPPNTLDGWRRHFRENLDAEVLKVGGTTASEKDNAAALLNTHVPTSGAPQVFFSSWEWSRKMIVTGEKYDKIKQKMVPNKVPALDTRGVGIDLLLADEIHRAQNKRSDSAVSYKELCRSVYGHDEGHTMGMSGTPAGNRLPGLFGVITGLWPEAFPHYVPWWKKYFEQEWNRYGGFPEPGAELLPGATVRALPLFWRHEQGVECCGFHPRGVQEDLPPRVIHRVLVGMTATQQRIYDDIEKEAFAWVEDNDWPIQTQGLPMIQHLRLNQVTMAVPTPEMVKVLRRNDDGVKELVDSLTIKYDLDAKSTKVDAVCEIAQDLGEEPFMVYTHSAAIIPVVVHRLRKMGITAEAWFGGVSHKERADIKERFLNGELRVIVAQVAAIGEGVDGLQWVCSNEIWLSRSANNMQNIQCAGRLSRDGQKRFVNVFEILAEGTVEEQSFYTQSENAAVLQNALHA